MALAPGSFDAWVAPFGVRNEHLLLGPGHGIAGAGRGRAARRDQATWRVPVLAITLLQFTLHTRNHLLDIGQAEPSWLGSAKALVLGWRPPPSAHSPCGTATGRTPGQPLKQDRTTTTMRSYVTGGSGVIGR